MRNTCKTIEHIHLFNRPSPANYSNNIIHTHNTKLYINAAVHRKNTPNSSPSVHFYALCLDSFALASLHPRHCNIRRRSVSTLSRAPLGSSLAAFHLAQATNQPSPTTQPVCCLTQLILLCTQNILRIVYESHPHEYAVSFKGRKKNLCLRHLFAWLACLALGVRPVPRKVRSSTPKVRFSSPFLAWFKCSHWL